MKLVLKTFTILCSVVCLMASCSQAEEKEEVTTEAESPGNNEVTSIQWIDSTVKVDNVVMGDKADIKFRFVNTGSKPLYIISAQPGCGCTVASYPKEAIAPNETGEIIANYDSNKGSIGYFSKSITIISNTINSPHVLTFNGEVISK